MNFKLTTIRNAFNAPKAFTMIELLVAMSIFMVFVALSSGAYIGLMKANKLASDNQRIYRDVRHVFDTLADEMHNNQIDYNCFAPNNGDPECVQNGSEPTVLAFTSGNTEIVYRRLYSFDNESKTITVKTQKKIPGTFDGWSPVTDAEPLTSPQTKFSDVTFSVFPLLNPYDSANVADATVQWQPSLTISIKKEGTTPGSVQEYRTTFSSRSYGKKSLYTPHIEVPKFDAKNIFGGTFPTF